MTPRAYYNENNPFCAQWLRNLIAAGLIAPGDVDDTSIIEVKPDDLRGYTQWHFFAGIGLWSDALRRAGWPDGRPAATASLPCQPLSVAGQRKGDLDERHLWPAFYRLVAECAFPVILGEQSASADGREWLAGIRFDLEGLGYDVGAADLCSAGVGAPHIRQRLYWVAYANRLRRDRLEVDAQQPGQTKEPWTEVAGCGRNAEGLAHARHEQTRRTSSAGEAEGRRPLGDAAGCGARVEGVEHPASQGSFPGAQREVYRGEAGARPRDGEPKRSSSIPQGMADAMHSGWSERRLGARGGPAAGGCGGNSPGLGDSGGARLAERESIGEDHEPEREAAERTGGSVVPQWNGPTAIIECLDGFRRISAQPGVFPLAHGNKGRMGVCRTVMQGAAGVQEEHWYNRTGALGAYGNAINPVLAAEFIAACEEARRS